MRRYYGGVQEFTVQDVSNICGQHTTHTILTLCQRGDIRAESRGPTRERIIRRPALIEYLTKNNIPCTALDAFIRVLIVSRDKEMCELLLTLLPPERSFHAIVTTNTFEEPFEHEADTPNAVIVDWDIGVHQAIDVCQNLHTVCGYRNIIIALVADRHASGQSYATKSVPRHPTDIMEIRPYLYEAVS